MFKIKIYDIDYLANDELTDDDLHHLFDCNALHGSFIHYMLKESGLELSRRKLHKVITLDNSWVMDNHLTSAQVAKVKHKFRQCIHNIYQYGPYHTKRWVDDWWIRYGLSIN